MSDKINDFLDALTSSTTTSSSSSSSSSGGKSNGVRKRAEVLPDFYLVPACVALYAFLVQFVWHLPRLHHGADGTVTVDAEVPLPGNLYERVPGAEVVHELVCAAFAFAFLFDLLTGVINGWNDGARRRFAFVFAQIFCL